MKNMAEVKERFLLDGLPVRFGNLAANIARVASFLNNSSNREALDNLLTESKFFIEWTAAETEVEIAAELVELQVQLARWQLNLAGILNDPTRQAQTIEQARRWSARILHISGLSQAA